MNKIILLFLTALIFTSSCKKDKELPPAELVGKWTCVQVIQYTAYRVSPYPYLNSDYTTLFSPVPYYAINISSDGMLSMSRNDTLILEEDFFTDELDDNSYRLHYYGKRKSKTTQFFDFSVNYDTMIIKSFFPYTNFIQDMGGGHGGSSNTYTFTNIFVRQ